eukprot:TRINITY_DN27450_c0_g1_i1.p1 TRINITY_DN27450_c0_g1~~TRINITY_DN27450_c0_g1_i1.p1  ORF type:complete len:387 (-),score=90.19 TRINITY_DN27450_c0_g1_i1:158-1318(-)
MHASGRNTFLCAAVLIALCASNADAGLTTAAPHDLLRLALGYVLDTDQAASVSTWDYTSAVVTDALWVIAAVYPDLNTSTSVLNKIMDGFISTKGAVAYNVLNGITMPFDGEVGDHIGLYPISYVARARYYSPNGRYDNSTDLKIATAVADQYVIAFPDRLSDGTFSRSNGSTVWCDDSFMGLTLISWLAPLLNKRSYIDTAAEMELTFATHLANPDGAYSHGDFYSQGQHSCCKCGRANGWIMMAHVEVLTGLLAFPGHPLQQQVVQVFQTHAAGIRKLQSPSGLWHEVLDVPDTFLETSCSGMFIWSFIRGVQGGWLDRDTFDPVIRLGYSGIASTVNANGTISGIVAGTGIGPNVSFYENRPTSFTGPGLGSVLKAILAYDSY